ncbi:MAG TPA: hypothetical protein EYH38_01115 [Leucothrix sp.]|nr:hypothetical protein [Leucothrix sp.]
MKALLVIFSILLILLLARLWVGTGSYPERWRTQERTTIQKAANEKRQAQIDKIQAELSDAKSGNDAIEERARSELGMTKKGETYFEVILSTEEGKETEKSKKNEWDSNAKNSTKNANKNNNKVESND